MTSPGIEVHSLREVEAQLQPRLQAFQVQRFGEVTGVEVGDLGR